MDLPFDLTIIQIITERRFKRMPKSSYTLQDLQGNPFLFFKGRSSNSLLGFWSNSILLANNWSNEVYAANIVAQNPIVIDFNLASYGAVTLADAVISPESAKAPFLSYLSKYSKCSFGTDNISAYLKESSHDVAIIKNICEGTPPELTLYPIYDVITLKPECLSNCYKVCNPLDRKYIKYSAKRVNLSDFFPDVVEEDGCAKTITRKREKKLLHPTEVIKWTEIIKWQLYPDTPKCKIIMSIKGLDSHYKARIRDNQKIYRLYNDTKRFSMPIIHPAYGEEWFKLNDPINIDITTSGHKAAKNICIEVEKC